MGDNQVFADNIYVRMSLLKFSNDIHDIDILPKLAYPVVVPNMHNMYVYPFLDQFLGNEQTNVVNVDRNFW